MRLKTRELVAFALLSVPLSMGGLPLGLYLTPYYTAELGLSLTSVGFILLLTRVTDVVTDPLIGTLSDHTPARFGRRPLWIMVGLPIMGFATIAVFDPPFEVSRLYLFVAVATLYLGWTLITIPLTAWAAELSPDYNERSRIMGARTIAGTSGTLLVLLLPIGLSYLVDMGYTSLAPESENSLQPMLRIVAWSTLALLVVTGPLMILLVPQPKFIQKTVLDFRQAIAIVARNKAFMRLLTAGVLTSLGWYCIATLYIFFLTFYLGADQKVWSALLLVYLACSLIGTPFIVQMSKRFSKHKLLAGLSVFAMVIFSTVLLMEPGDYMYYTFIQVFAGLVANAGQVLVPSMAADVIDQDTLESGQQRGALFMALWGMADKLALAAAAGITLPLLDFFGFDPTAANDEAGLRALHFTYTFVPLILLSWAAWLIWRFPITRERQEDFRKEILDRQMRVD